tara:strand:- start:171 stop:386 length:216 start_codon:yes stop_codon:yes gene_type:complete
MSDRPTPETDEASFSTVIQGELVQASFARRLERQRDAYAETLRLIATANDRSHHEAAFAALIRNRHPELTP